MNSGDDGRGGGGSAKGNYSGFWGNILGFANGDDGAGYIVDRDGKIISTPSNSNLLGVWLQTSSKDGQGMDQVAYEFLGNLGGVRNSDKIITDILHDDAIGASHMSPSDFKQAVEDHGIWDYKTNTNYIYGEAALFDKNNSKYGFKTNFIFNSSLMTAEDFGNFHYGVVGLANGNFTETMLFVAAGYVQMRDHHSRSEWQNTTYFGDEPKDHYWIQQGFNYYHSNY